jgi:hypothetical protein
MTRDAVASDQLPPSGLPFSVAVRGCGRSSLTPGRAGGPGPATGQLIDGDVAQQADQTLRPRRVLAAGGHGEAEVGRGGLGGYADLRDVQGVHDDEVTVPAVPGRRGGADVACCAGVVGQLIGTLGKAEPISSPAPSDSWVTVAGMSATAQCQKPEPVGASGSYTVTA